MVAESSSRGESRPSSPIARLLSGAVALVLRRLGIRPSTEEEIQVLLREGIEAGTIGEAEHEIVTRVLRLGSHRASELMTPMNEIVWLDVADPPEEMKRKIADCPHTRFPVCEGSIDDILGIVQVKDLLVQTFRGQPFGIKGLCKLPLFLYEGTPGLNVLELFQKSGMHVAIVLDEFGSVRGLLTLTDILEAIVGDLPVGEEPEEPRAVRREDGSWLLDGTIPVDEFKELLGIGKLPRGDFQTLAGLVITLLGRIPKTGDRLEWEGYRCEVVDMDGLRVDKVLVGPLEKA
jgi:putative hemolysin